MNLRRYQATARKMHVAYVALKTAMITAEFTQRERISMALDPLQAAVNALRVQVCKDCNARGYFEKPDDPYTSYGCLHEKVPFIDVRTGEEKQMEQWEKELLS